MPASDIDLLTEHFQRSALALQSACADETFLRTCHAIACTCARALSSGGKILLIGNGGSAADAQHIAAELVGRLNRDRAPLPAIALTVDTSVLTAIGNDYGFEQIFERQVAALANPGDVLIALSASGRSLNILAALRTARARGLTTIGLTGRGGGELAPLCDLVLSAPSASTPLIQQVHMAAAHAVCGSIEAALFQDTGILGASNAA